ncbi:MAG TPA: filamentous hemagglutinin N-terminal domain-containing protein, partial [Gammaproteobacteria bacterium]|nr:filamentous hemagglutinin N-terminal domain-containing protein [Gammaproteobacteria bacterium]
MNTHSHLFKVIAQLLIGVMCGQPLLSLAADLRVDLNAGGYTQITQAGNGVPIVNIATPKGNGLSHNKFADYNVDKQGLILNNSTDKFTHTELGGIIVGNSQLHGQSARLILNEVTGGRASQLKGYTEVAGKQAHVVIANPHGITCDGCGFINTPHATLTTGKPIIEQDQLKRYDVNGGQVEITGAGLNASNISQFDLITRSAKINAELHANQLNIITGRNSVNAQTLAATAKENSQTDKPSLAIDSSALGGMYAGAIRLVGTEAGVGVKLAGDMAASAGDIQIDTTGKLTLAHLSAKQQINASAQGVELTKQVYAGDKVKFNADTLTNKSNLLAANGIDLIVNEIDNQGLIEAGLGEDNTLNGTADIRIKSTELKNTGSVIASRHIQIDSKRKLSNTAGSLVADGGLTVTTNQLDNQQGLITAVGTVDVSAQQINNRNQGEISSQVQLTVSADTLDNRDSGRVLSNAALNLNVQQINNTDGVVDTQGNLNIAAQSIDNSSGHIVGDGGVRIISDRLDNQAGGLILSHGTLEATVKTLTNQQGALVADAGVHLKGQALNNAAGRINSQNSVQLDYTELNNTQGLVVAGNDLTIGAQIVENAQGELSAGQTLALDTQLLKQKKGQILSAGKMRLSAQILDNTGQGLISAGTDLTIEADQLDNQEQGTVMSDGVLSIQARQLNNNGKGLLASKELLQVQTDRLDQHSQGELISGKAIQLNLSGGDLNNSQGGLIYAPQLQLQRVALLNNSQGGEISTVENLDLNAAQLNNSGGLINSGKTLQVRVEGIINNTVQGLLSAGQDLQISALSLDNSQKGILIANGDLSLLANQQVNNSQNGTILANGKLQLSSADLKNTHSGL